MRRLPVAVLVLFLLTLSGASPEASRYWNGTWSTSHGELRLASVGRFVVGDYGDRGVFVGRSHGGGLQHLRGVFTNNGRVGEIEFARRSESFSGTWNWKGETASGGWTGQRTSQAAPTLRNFARDGRELRPIDNDRQFADGTYTSAHGEVRLLTQDLVMVGDYGDKGIFAGVWDGTGYVGQFTNGPRAGWFTFSYLSRPGTFRSGSWGWVGDEGASAWTLTKQSSANLLSYLGEDAPAPARPSAGTFLRRGMDLDVDRVRTLVSMQEHVQWVSGDEDVALREMAASRFTMHGGGFIDTEESGVSGLFTTGRLRAYVAHRGSDLVIVFRGSSGSNVAETIGNGGTDLLIIKRKVSFLENSPRLTRTGHEGRNSRVHSGFANAYDRLRPQILAALDANPNKNVYVFGHSLGGALATLCAIDLSINRNSSTSARSITHIVSGSPRVGDGLFYSLFRSAVPNNMRVTLEEDPVAKIPRGYAVPLFPNKHYRHVGRLLPLAANGTIQSASQIRTERGNNTFSNHANTAYLQAARDLLQSVESNPSLLNGVNIEALGDAERTSAED